MMAHKMSAVPVLAGSSSQSIYKDLSENFKPAYTELLDPSIQNFVRMMSLKKSAPLEFLTAAIIPGTTVMMGNCTILAHDVS